MNELLICDICGWEGSVEDLGNGVDNFTCCPNCHANGKHIKDPDRFCDYDNQVMGGGAFNWNKK